MSTIADACGGRWPNRVRAALVQLLTVQHAPTPENELLQAIRHFRDDLKKGKDFFISREFCTWANRQEERPWSEKPLTPAKLAGMLRQYEIHPIQINRLDTRTADRQKNLRGYRFGQFAAAFERYLDTSSEALGR